MKLNWFSPVPPTPSSIAFDTAAILPALAERAHITLFVQQANWDPALARNARVIEYQPMNLPWRELNQADATIYHFGNQAAFHAPIWRVNRQHPGIVVLHDLCLQNFFAGTVEQKLGLTDSEYRAIMVFYHGKRGAWLADGLLKKAIRCNDIREECSLTGAALENAIGLIVHTPNAYATLRQSTDLPVSYVPLFVHPDQFATQCDPAGDAAVKEKDCYRIIMFGFLTTNRRLKSVVRVLANFPQRHRYRLDVYGVVEEEEEIRHLIERSALQDRVTLHGFVADSELAAALARSDLSINLRDPTMGEASASQLRMWQNALPTLVTDTGSYSTLPPDTVAFVRRYAEAEDIEMHLAAFLRDPEIYRRLGQNGRRHVEHHHSVGIYVRELLASIEKIMRHKHRAMVRRMTHRAGAAMRPWFTAEAADLLTRNVAEKISDLANDDPGGPPREIADVSSPTPG